MVGDSALGARPMVVVGVCFVGGVAAGPSVGLSGGTAVLLAGVLGLISFSLGQRPGAFLVALMSLWCLGCAVAGSAVARQVPEVSDARVVVEGTLESLKRGPEGATLTLRVDQVNDEASQFRALLFAPQPGPWVEGQRLRVPVKLRTLRPALNPGEADRYAFQVRRGAVRHGAFDGDAVVITGDADAVAHWLMQTHQALARAVVGLSDDDDAAALLLTLTSGERGRLSDEGELMFARSGLAHILSVSGLHVAVLALALFAGLRWSLTRRQWPWARRFDAQRVAAVIALGPVWAFVWFTGWQGPAIRSALMVSLVMLGTVVRRRAEPLSALSFAMCVMVAVQPWSIADLSVQLSFLSVLALVLLTSPIRAAIPVAVPQYEEVARWRQVIRRWRETAVTTFAASVAVTLTSAPLIAQVFGRVSVVGLVSNVVMLPLCSALTLVSVVGAAVFTVSPVGAAPLLWVGVQLAQLVTRGAQVFSALPGAGVSVSAPSAAACALWWLGLLWFALASTRVRWWALLGPAAAVVLTVGVPSGRGAGADLEVTFLSVGHGDAIVVSAHGHHAIIDAGGVPNGADVGTRVVLPFLKSRGIDRFDFAVLTHPHPDHALGLVSVLKAVPAGELWLSDDFEGGALVDQVIDAAAGARVRTVSTATQPVQLGDARVEVLGPPPAADQLLLESENDRSVVLRVSLGQTAFVLTGDLETAGEEALADVRRSAGETLVLKVPHHGSRTSSSERLVRQARPQFAVFSVGRENRFHFPHAEIVQRYQAVGAAIVRTDTQGAVRFSTDGHQLQVSPFLE